VKAGDEIELPPGVSRAGGSWRFRRRRLHNGRFEDLASYVDKDYEKVIAFAKQWNAEYDREKEDA
jgi:hypothetical protein